MTTMFQLVAVHAEGRTLTVNQVAIFSTIDSHNAGLLFLGDVMRYHSNKPKYVRRAYGKIVRTDHPVYNYGTCFQKDGKALFIIQQYFDQNTKNTYWGPVEAWITQLIFENEHFDKLFAKYADTIEQVSTISMRHALHFLKIKPPKKEIG